jgi:hypothetical protein
MTKKFISATLAFLFIFTALTSCRGTPVEEDAPALTTVPETTEVSTAVNEYKYEVLPYEWEQHR